MNNELTKYPILRVDWVIILLYLILIVCGWMSICGATHEVGNTDFFSWGTRTGKQLVWISCALVLGFIVLMTDDKYYDTLSGFLYTVMMVVLFITPFIAKDIKGSRSWVNLGFCNLQPAEFAKCITALAVAKLINQYGFTLSNMRNFAKAAGLILLPMALIIMQRETGSALVYLAFFLMFYREGMPGCILITAVAAVAYFVIGIRFGEVELPGTLTSVGEFVVLIMIWIFTMGMVRVYASKTKFERLFLLVGSVALTIALLVSEFLTLRRVVGTVSPLRVHGRLFGLAIVGTARQHLPVHSHFHHRQCRPALYRRLCPQQCARKTPARAHTSVARHERRQ